MTHDVEGHAVDQEPATDTQPQPAPTPNAFTEALKKMRLHAVLTVRDADKAGESTT